MQKVLFALSITIFFACTTQNKNEATSSDSTAIDTLVVANASPSETSEPVNWASPVEGLLNADSLFNILARQKRVRGKFEAVTVLTEELLDAGNLTSSRNLLAVLVHSSEEENESNTKYAGVAAFERQATQVILLDFVNLGGTTSYGLQQNSIDGDSIQLAENKFAVLLHYKSSEEGAGDSGFRKDYGEVHVLLNNKLTKIFETGLEDFGFSSNETDSYYEHTTTTVLTVLPEKTKGLFNLQTNTSTISTGFDETEEGEEAEPPAEDTAEEGEQTDGMRTYQWNGTEYENVTTN